MVQAKISIFVALFICLIFQFIESSKLNENVLDCILKNPRFVSVSDRNFLTYPIDANEHYMHLKMQTKVFRNYNLSTYADFQGPWIENLFINNYIDKDLSYFNGFIPLFIQWTDAQNVKPLNSTTKDIINTLRSLLRPNVLYLAISQSGIGLHDIGKQFPNIFVLSSGGFGNVATPLLMQELPLIEQPQRFDTLIGFWGWEKSSKNRREILRNFKRVAHSLNMNIEYNKSKNWLYLMNNTKFNLAPRGTGRTSFRLSEIIQIGRVPVYLYDDIPWLPYNNTSISIESYGFSAGYHDEKNSFPMLAKRLNELTQAEYDEKLANVYKVRHYFTYKGFFEQLDLFLADPFGPKGGYFTCSPYPYSVTGCFANITIEERKSHPSWNWCTKYA